MTIQDWAIIIIAISAPIAALATLFAPSLAEIVKFRINQPKPSPDPNQPEKRNQRNGGLSLKRRFWFPTFICIVEVFFLVSLLRSPDPIDKTSVFMISLIISSVFFMTLSMVVLYFTSKTFEIFGLQIGVYEANEERIKELTSWLATITRSLTAAFNEDTAQAKRIMEALKPPLTTEPK